VLLRFLLLLPQFVVTAVLGIAAFFVTVVGWFAALFTGRLPTGVADFLGGYLAYETRVTASATLLVDHYPPFSFDGQGHPARIELRPGELNRLAVLFRIVLMIPAAVVTSLLQYGLGAVCWVFWLITLVLGRMPVPVFGAVAAVVRFRMRYQAYVMMLTSAYPKRLFGDGPPVGQSLAPAAAAVPSATRPLLLAAPAKALLVLLIVLGVLGAVASQTLQIRQERWGPEDDSRAATASIRTS
ncbi:DUF4389 domain-containing protein, partial [Streptomyces sp. NPDC058157]|uniref:DUF4389 domain-containing protein n=1 Tax=Streptomyces sp. NPDC058157 TaxID=3346360 RepID=UPI0036DFB6FB